MASETTFLHDAAIYMAAAVVAVPVFNRLKLGSVLGYLAAGSIIGPFGVGLITDAESVLHFAEFGVVLLLFVIGLELQPSRLWAIRGDIFGLGFAQVLITGGLLTGFALFFGLPLNVSLVAGFGLALSSTAFALQIMSDRGELNTPHGRKAFGILLFQDLAIVPLLALVGFLAPVSGDGTGSDILGIAITVGAIAAVIIAGRFLLGPFFRLIAKGGTREVFLAAALLVVTGTALLMQAVGLSMAMGAFLAGVMLAESEFRHQLEADIEPFRGLLLGLFFMAVGMGLNWGVVLESYAWIVLGVFMLVLLKALVLYGATRIAGQGFADALRITGLLSQGGEFAFVLFAAAGAAGLMQDSLTTLLGVIVTLSMVLTPFLVKAVDVFLAKKETDQPMDDIEGVEEAPHHKVIITGFGRVGQVVSQIIQARGIKVTTIDNDPERIRIARRFGNKVYYGNAKRLDVLKAAGIDEADMIILAVGKTSVCNSIISEIRKHYPSVKILVRAYDREHALQLMDMDVDYFMRETFESSLKMGQEALKLLGTESELVEEIVGNFRKRDQERLDIQQVEGVYAAADHARLTPDLECVPPQTRKTSE